MSDIRDNPPPLLADELTLLASQVVLERKEDGTDPTFVLAFGRKVAAAAFERGKAARQGEIERLKETIQDLRDQWDREIDVIAERDDLRAKLKALEEQKPVAWRHWYQYGQGKWVYTEQQYEHSQDALYLAAGAKP